MRIMNVDHTDVRLSRLLEGAHSGETFIVAQGDTPLVQITNMTAPPAKRPRVGFMPEIGPIPDDFDRMFEDEIDALFNGTADAA